MSNIQNASPDEDDDQNLDDAEAGDESSDEAEDGDSENSASPAPGTSVPLGRSATEPVIKNH